MLLVNVVLFCQFFFRKRKNIVKISAAQIFNNCTLTMFQIKIIIREGSCIDLFCFISSTFNFTVPYLSCIAIILLVSATIVLYIMPVRYLLMLWGTNKFFRRILRPHAVPNNEILDLLSRIPDDELLVSTFREKKICGFKQMANLWLLYRLHCLNIRILWL